MPTTTLTPTSAWQQLGWSLLSPSFPDFVGSSLGASQEYIKTSIATYLQPIIAKDGFDANTLRKRAWEFQREAAAMRESLRTYNPANRLQENIKRMMTAIAESREANVARDLRLADNAAAHGMSAASRAAMALEFAREIGAIAGMLDTLIKGQEALTSGDWGPVGAAGVAAIAGLATGAAIATALATAPLWVTLSAGIIGGYVAGKIGETLLWPIIDAGAKILIPKDFWDTVLPCTDVVLSAVNFYFSRSLSPRPRDPLAIDLDGDGIETFMPNFGAVVFDHDADGVKTGTGWLKGDDAWLVMDRNGNGSIDSGRELFGVDTQITRTGTYLSADGSQHSWTSVSNASSGFEALAALDQNGDKVFDANDSAFGAVRLWQDLNHDGISQQEELSTLAQKGISGINLTPNSSSQDLGGGNSVTGKAAITWSNGTSGEVDAIALGGTASNLNLADNPFYREFGDRIPPTTTALNLPEMGGSGWVRDMREALSMNSNAAATMVATVSSFKSANTRDAQLATLDAMLNDWARTSGRLSGFGPTGVAYLSRTVLSTNEAGQATVRYITATLEAGVDYSLTDYALVDLPTQYYLEQTDAYGRRYRTFTEAGIAVLEKLNILEVFNAQRLVNATSIERTSSNTGQVEGGSSGGSTTSIPQARQLFTVSFSQEQIDLFETAYDALRESVYGALVMQTRLRPYLDNINLLIDEQGIHFDISAVVTMLEAKRSVNESEAYGDLVDLNRYGHSTLLAVGMDGMSVLRGWIESLPAGAPVLAKLAAMDVFLGNASHGSWRSDIYLGDGASNRFAAGAGNDQLAGGAGNDILNGDADDDTLDGGAGNDTLQGGSGNDTYLFGLGSGKDLVINDDAATNRHDLIKIGLGILPSELSLIQEGSDLLISAKSSADQIRIQGHFYSNGSLKSIDLITFSDGTEWDLAKIASLTHKATVGDDVLVYGGSDDSIFGLAGSDTIDGGVGNDTLNGGDGSDTLVGGVGNDSLMGESGNDVYILTKGAGHDVISDLDASTSSQDEVKFIDLASTEVTAIERKGNDLVISYGANDRVTLQSYFGVSFYLIEKVSFSDGATWEEAAIKARTATPGTADADTLIGYDGGSNRIYGYQGNDSLSGGTMADTIEGGLGNDSLMGNADADLLDGGEGNDALIGGDGSDTLVGGAGNDLLRGESGNDMYILTRGAGQDVIFDIDSAAGSQDELKFVDVASTEVAAIERKGNDLVISYGAGDRVTLQSYFGAPYYLIEKVSFSDGVTWNTIQIKARTVTQGGGSGDYLVGYDGAPNAINGLAGADTICGGDGADTIDGGADNDTIIGYAGNDSIIGGAGNDNLTGDLGNDTLIGGAGNDTLNGDAGDDTFLFASGFGQDVLNQYDDSATRLDVVKFTDLTSTDLVAVERLGANLILRFSSGDQLTLVSYYGSDTSATQKINQIQFSDGVIWGMAQIKAKTVTQGGAGGDYLVGHNDAPNAINGLAGNDTLYGGNGADMIDGGADNDTIIGFAGDDTIMGGSGNDNLAGDVGNDSLIGDAGNDTLNGDTGDDTLSGGLGNDSVYGGAGNDVYLFEVGHGYDFIHGQRNEDVLRLGTGIQPGDVRFERYYDNLDLVIRQSGVEVGRIVLVNQAFDGTNTYTGVKQIEFADGTVWGGAALRAMALIGTDANEANLRGYLSNDLLNGMGGNDSMWGGVGNDTLFGGTGNDSISGDAGDDTIEGGVGDDFMTGGTHGGSDGAGNDTYVFGPGFGKDTIYDKDSTGGVKDVVVFKQGIAKTDVMFARSGVNLVVSFTGTSDQITILDWFTSAAYRIEEFRFADGQVLTELQVTASVPVIGTAGNDYMTGTAGNDSVFGAAGNDTLDGGMGNDTLSGGAGNDSLYGGAGNDVYLFEVGHGYDFIHGQRNEDVLRLGAGIQPGDVRFERYYDNLDLVIRQSGVEVGRIVLVNQALDGTNAYTGVQKIEFADGTVWAAASLRAVALIGTDANEANLRGYVSNDLLNGMGGNDSMWGGAGNDTLFGGAGNDSITGEAGDDILDGGAGNDSLMGGVGADTYMFGRGYGLDRIVENDSTASVKDVVKFGTGVAAADIKFTKNGNSLDVSILGTSDILTIQDWYLGTQYRVEEFRFANGTVLTDVQAQGLVQAMAAFKPASMESATDSYAANRRSFELVANAMA